LPVAAALDVEDAGEDAQRQVERAAAEVADQRRRRQRCLARLSRVPERPREGDVVEIVAGALRQRPVLPPAGHAAINESGLAGQAGLRPEPEPFHDARPHAFDQRIATFDHAQHQFGSARRLEVDADRLFAAIEDRLPAQAQGSGLSGSLDEDHLGAHIGEQHARERTGADAGDFENADAGQRAALRRRHLTVLRSRRR